MQIMLWNLIPAPFRVGIIVAVLTAAVGFYFVARQQAYSEGYGKAQIECTAEKQAQAAANAKVATDAEKRLFEAADTLSIRNMELDDAIDSLSAAAVARPGSDIVCLDADSLRNLNAIR
jgi:hypothetical protein